jgi:gamma-glutamyltranspeptidase / glutathione hydrolase
MHLDLEAFPYPGKPYPAMRHPVFSARGMVATSQPLATQTGLAILRRGGNAVDSALAMSVALTVLEPMNSGIGGDIFALVWDGQTLHGLNGSGRSPAALTPDHVRALGHMQEMPEHGWLPVTVPGAPAAWSDLHRRFGSLPFDDLVADSLAYAEEGYPVSPVAARDWGWSFESLERDLSAEAFDAWAAIFAPDGHAPAPGEVWRCPDMAHSLRLIAETDGAAVYTGELARAISEHAARSGGLVNADDLAQHASDWVDPISVSYRGYDVWEMPPNGQGLAALIALNILEGFDIGRTPRDSMTSYHRQIEAMKLAFVDAQRFVADPAHSSVPVAALLSKGYAAGRRALIGELALDPEPGVPQQGGTSYLCVADQAGMMVSLIQSTCGGFGSGIVVPGYGVALQNRGVGFSLEAGHPNAVAPSKRPRHTIVPAFLTYGTEAIGPFGVVGGHAQPQGHVQLIVNTLDYGMNPQAAHDAPRWFWWEGREIKVEPATAAALVAELEAHGHLVEVDHEIDVFGCGQALWRLPGGIYVGGSDGRTDGCALGW